MESDSISALEENEGITRHPLGHPSDPTTHEHAQAEDYKENISNEALDTGEPDKKTHHERLQHVVTAKPHPARKDQD
ncbi:hypothetical protein [Acidithiobacillus ferrooxidans]|uniref:hypothetical protein n=1 Tax=Acidithiobacillus ferrooxidans TaxID=920 RepID=UPI001C07D031|nr:hypothetical protein [Acidithiobacillus ferrooxidans]